MWRVRGRWEGLTTGLLGCGESVGEGAVLRVGKGEWEGGLSRRWVVVVVEWPVGSFGHRALRVWGLLYGR